MFNSKNIINIDSIIIKKLDCKKPCFASLHQSFPQQFPAILESVVLQSNQRNWDIVFAFPSDVIELTADDILKNTINESPDFFESINLWYKKEQVIDSTPYPFIGGWFIYCSYDLSLHVEEKLKLLPTTNSEQPIALAMRIHSALIWDHENNQLLIIAEKGYEHLIDEIESKLNQFNLLDFNPKYLLEKPLREEDPEKFINAVKKIKQYIYDGDVFQVNMSRQWQGKLKANVTASQLYHQLKQANPAPFSGLMSYKGYSVISSSPERLVKLDGNIVSTRPIAGTRPRNHQTSNDNATTDELIRHPKERAEHIMLIDLERNDLGRICVPGSINVNEMMVVENYQHVHHIVSNIVGQLDASFLPGDIIKAIFPGGTITGCPKVRCMQIITELEGMRRGAYTGSMGYLSRDGKMDSNILIRSIEVFNDGLLSFRAGAGIVADSIEAKEVEETRAKAKGMKLALTGKF